MMKTKIIALFSAMMMSFAFAGNAYANQTLINAANEALHNRALLAAATSASNYFAQHVEADTAGTRVGTLTGAHQYAGHYYEYNSYTNSGRWVSDSGYVNLTEYIAKRAEVESQSHMWIIRVTHDGTRYRVDGMGVDRIIRTTVYGVDFAAVANDIYEEGYKDGYEDGYRDGFRDGYAVGCSVGNNTC